MWLVYMIYPEINTSGSSRKGAVLAARGLVRIEEMQVGHATSQDEARRLCVKLGVQTLKDHGRDTTVIGYGIRNYYEKKGKRLAWQMSVQQLLEVLRVRKDRQTKAAALAADKTRRRTAKAA